MAPDRTHVASGTPPVVTVEVIRKGGALVAFESYGMALVIGSVLWVGNSLVGITSDGSAAASITLLNVAILAIGSGRLWRRRGDRVELSPHGVRVLRQWSDASLAWGEITELAEQRVLGRDVLVARNAAQPGRSLPVLDSGPSIWRDPDYEAKAQRIRDYRTAYRWSSFSPPGDRPPPPP